MQPFHLPANLVASAGSDPDPVRRDWIATLPGVVASLAGRWSLELGEPFQPGGQTSWVAPVRNAAGEDLVLKVGWSHPEAAHESDGLVAWDGQGAVLLRDKADLGGAAALLLERCLPGDSLEKLAEDEQDAVVAGLLRRLWIEPSPGHPFRPLSVMCEEWADEFEERNATSPAPVDAGLARDGMELFRELPRTAEREVLLCTDLHAGNILAAEREPWLAVDPKPYVGDPAYDVLQHLLNCEQRLVTDPDGLVARMADLLDLGRERLRTWLFARCVQEAVGRPALCVVARRIAPR